jgi:hypothetical protein
MLPLPLAPQSILIQTSKVGPTSYIFGLDRVVWLKEFMIQVSDRWLRFLVVLVGKQLTETCLFSNQP